MITFRAIRPAHKFKSSTFRDKLRARAETLAPKMERDMAKPTKTWSTPVAFETAVKVGNAAAGKTSGVSVEVITEDERYKFVDEGTKVRYATMSKDFRAKTKVNSLSAGRGRGKRLFVNKKRPRPGIKARGFTKIVHKTWQPIFRKEMQDALNEAAKASGHGG